MDWSLQPSSVALRAQDTFAGFITPSRLHPVTEDELQILDTPHNDHESKSSTPQARPARVKRPHTKSRRGCYNCKARRIKCQETKPSCDNCIHKEIECVYPSAGSQQRVLPRASAQYIYLEPVESPPAPLVPRQLSPTSFTGDDLRFFHHFLLAARPHLPFGNERAWMTDVPAFAHDCPHLMHAILSLGATHYALVTPNGSQYFPTAIVHRGKALKHLNAMLAKGDDCTVGEMDGVLAACYSLCFQAHHMDDGMVDFAVMVRGCATITHWFFEKRRTSDLFRLQSPPEVMELVGSWLPPDPAEVKDKETIEASLATLALLEPLLQSAAHRDFYDILRRAYVALTVSPQESFRCLSEIYAVWSQMGNFEFLTFLAPGNYVSRALFMHYLTIDVFMRPVFTKLGQSKRYMFLSAHFLIYKWADMLYYSLPAGMRELVREQADLVAEDLQMELRERCRPPEWARELLFLADWLQRKPTPSDIARSGFESSLIG